MKRNLVNKTDHPREITSIGVWMHGWLRPNLFPVVQEEDDGDLQAMLWIGQVHWDKRISWHHRVRRRIATFGVSIWKPEEEIQNVPAGFEDEKGLWPKVLLTKVLWKRSSDPQSESLGRCVNFGIKPTKISFLICLHFICS